MPQLYAEKIVALREIAAAWSRHCYLISTVYIDGSLYLYRKNNNAVIFIAHLCSYHNSLFRSDGQQAGSL